MKVFIDGEEREWEFPDSHNLKEAILRISEELLSNLKRVISELKLGETENGVDMQLTPEEVPVSRIKSIFLTTEPYKDALLREVRAAGDKLQVSLDSFNAIPEHLVAGEVDVAMERMKVGVETLILSFGALQQTFLSEAIDPRAFAIGGGSMDSFIADFNGKLKVLTEAMENKDNVLINDYLEYEIAPAILTLKEALPQMEEIIQGWE